MNNYHNLCPLVSDCTIGYNLSVSYNTRLKSRRKIQSHSLYVPAKHNFDTFYSKQDIAVGIFHIRNNHFFTNQMFFDNHVASFASTHSKTRQSDVIWCHQHGICDHGSINTLMTKLLWKQWIITICPLLSDCTIGYNFSVSYSNGLTYRQTMSSHSLYVHAKFHFENVNSKHDIVVGIYHVRNNQFLTNQMLSDSHVAYFASTHSKTRHSDVIGRR